MLVNVMYIMKNTPGLTQSLTDNDVLAVVLAAILHDYEHPGYNNNYMVASRSELTHIYNDTSVLENHHASKGTYMTVQ